MANGNFSLVQKAVHAIAYNGICQLCQQPTNKPFNYLGRVFADTAHISSTKAHVEAKSRGGKWSNGNIFEAHLYCNRLMQDLGQNDLEWIVRSFFSNYTSINKLNASIERANNLYSRTIATLDGKRQMDDDVRVVLVRVAKQIISSPDVDAVKRIYRKRRETILKLAA